MASNEIPPSHSAAVLELLREAGWSPERDVSEQYVEPFGASVFPAAQAVLRQFGGLYIGKCGPGIECATSDIELDPQLAVHTLADLKADEERLNTKFFALGEVHRGNGYLLIDEQGRAYLLGDKLMYYAPNFPRVLELLLLGKRASKAELADN